MPEFRSYRQLLCTFSTENTYISIIDQIKTFYDVYNNKIFIFSNLNDSNEIYLTYNVVDINKDGKKFPNTILIHRKKQTNTLYTLNALNKLIKDENGGTLDKTFIIDWMLYQNSLILTGDVLIKIIPLNYRGISK